MARDSSPLAQRLKALAARAGRPAAGEAAALADPAAEASAAQAPVEPSSAVDADELPTGDFPAVPEPTPDPSAPEVDGAGTPVAEVAPGPDQAPAAPEPVSEVAPEADLADETPAVPELGNAVTPPPVSYDEPSPMQPPAPTWPAPSAQADLPPEPSPSVRPIWLDPPPQNEVPSAPATPQPSPDDTVAESTTGPTLSPPVVPKREIPEPIDVTPDLFEKPPVQAPEPSYPAEPAGDTTSGDTSTDFSPAALNDALALPDDEAAATPDPEPADERAETPSLTSPPQSVPSPLAAAADDDSGASTDEGSEPAAPAQEATELDDQPTLIQDAVPAPARRLRLTRPGFLKRPETGDASGQAATPSAEDEAADDALAAYVDGETPTPEPAANEAETTAFVPVPASQSTSADEPAPIIPFDQPDLAAAEKSGSLTSRFRLRLRAKPTADDATTPAATAASEPQAEPVPASAPEHLVTDPIAYKPSFAERAALRRRAKSLRGRRDAGLLELGAIVLDQSRFGDPSAGALVRRRTTELADLDSEIAAIESALEDEQPAEVIQQLGVVHCTNCNSLLGPTDQFCAQCGTARPASGAGPTAS